jgi:hypothetical protein
MCGRMHGSLYVATIFTATFCCGDEDRRGLGHNHRVDGRR